MARPTGSKSGYKKKNILKYNEIKQVVNDYGKISNKELIKKYNISASQLKNIRDSYSLKNKNLSPFLKNRILDINSKDVVCGVYIICRDDFQKAYIGSSYDIYNRLRDHIGQLKNDMHYNPSLQADFNKYEFYIFITEQCEESELLKKENAIINSLNNNILYNKNYQTEDISIKDIFNEMIYKINKIENGCWEWLGKPNKDGYGSIRKNNKYYLTHRISYIYHYNTYPYLVHHKCENKICCNPDHLESASCKANSGRETSIEKSKLFPYKDIIIEKVKQKHSFRKIASELDIEVNGTTVFSFVKKLKALGLL